MIGLSSAEIKRKFEESAKLVNDYISKLKDREEAIDQYKKKIVALEFA